MVDGFYCFHDLLYVVWFFDNTFFGIEDEYGRSSCDVVASCDGVVIRILHVHINPWVAIFCNVKFPCGAVSIEVYRNYFKTGRPEFGIILFNLWKKLLAVRTLHGPENQYNSLAFHLQEFCFCRVGLNLEVWGNTSNCSVGNSVELGI